MAEKIPTYTQFVYYISDHLFFSVNLKIRECMGSYYEHEVCRFYSFANVFNLCHAFVNVFYFNL